ncbi:MAG: hypothetical protein FAF05_06950 [Epsilonproteobacteria bacterium]|nr:hypothetical protein [Campylobacterota bacterium]
MSLKENIDMVKDELNSEEKFFEKAVMTEKFVKKYKKPLIGSLVAIVLIVAADIGYEVNKQNTLEAANKTLKELQAQKGVNRAVVARLESLSPALHDLWSYANAVAKQDVASLEKLKKSKAMLIDDLAEYEAAQEKSDVDALEKYAQNKDAVYRDLALVQVAVIKMQEGKVDEAHSTLALIASQSPLYNVAKSLQHYGVK